MTSAFYVREDEHFIASESCRGPWHADFQHAGPPSGLIAHGVEAAADGMQVVRIGIDLLKPVPIGRLGLRVRERTGGKRRRLLEAELLAIDSELVVARAQALLLRSEPLRLGPLPDNDPPPPAAPEQAEPATFDFFKADIGYHTAMELRLESGGIGSGRTRMWMRQRIPLIEDLETSPLQRLMVIADSGNGVSMVLDPQQHGFMNPDLTVNIRRPPAGDWLCLDAVTNVQASGLGIAESRIWDRQGIVANGNQNLLIETRS